MARRPEFPPPPERPMTDEELVDLRRSLSMVSPYHVVQAYRDAYEKCRMDGDRLPSARAVQELVTAWKLLWKWRRGR